MKVAVISDSHDRIEHITDFVEKAREMKIKTVFHAGDFCSPFTIPFFEGLKLIGVFGNNDGDHYRIMQKFAEIQGEMYNEFHERTIGGKHIALYHGTQPSITQALVMCGNYDLVISGHTHTAVNEGHGKTLWLNPGSLHGFAGKGSFAVYDTASGRAEIMEL